MLREATLPLLYLFEVARFVAVDSAIKCVEKNGAS